MKALVADDSEVQRLQLKSWLEEVGFQVVTAVDGQAAWDSYTTDIDLVVLDQLMPACTGIEFCRALWKKRVNTLKESGAINQKLMNQLCRDQAFKNEDLRKQTERLFTGAKPRICFLTSNPRVVEKEEARFLGINYWILKPIDRDSFLQLINTEFF